MKSDPVTKGSDGSSLSMEEFHCFPGADNPPHLGINTVLADDLHVLFSQRTPGTPTL